MIELFYLLGIGAIALEVQALLKPSKMLRIAKAANEKIDDEGTDSRTIAQNMSKEERNLLIRDLSYLVWVILGIIFTPEWPLFMGIVALSLISKGKMGAWWVVIDAILSIVLLAFILGNHYFLHVL